MSSESHGTHAASPVTNPFCVLGGCWGRCEEAGSELSEFADSACCVVIELW